MWHEEEREKALRYIREKMNDMRKPLGDMYVLWEKWIYMGYIYEEETSKIGRK